MKDQIGKTMELLTDSATLQKEQDLNEALNFKNIAYITIKMEPYRGLTQRPTTVSELVTQPTTV